MLLNFEAEVKILRTEAKGSRGQGQVTRPRPKLASRPVWPRGFNISVVRT